MKSLHQDNEVELKLRIVKESVPGSTKRLTTVKEFNEHLFHIKYFSYFKKVPFFKVTERDFFYATKSIDEWIMDYYKKDPDIIESYTNPKINQMPPNLEKDLPTTYRVYWDILVKRNQNKFCNFMVQSKPIDGFEGLNISLWSGFKVIGPFTTEMKTYYNIMTIKGKTSDIDTFVKHIGPK